MDPALKILQTLIEIPSVSRDFKANNKALEYIDQFLSKRGMHVARFEFNGFGSLVATTHPTKTPTVMLVGHVDVVPGETDQYTLREADGKLYGRGVLDMKAAVAAYLQIVDDLQDTLDQYDFGIMIVSDEEIGGFNGVVPLLAKGYAPKMCVIPDGTPGWALETFAKGMWIGDITVEGKAAHGSRPWEGDNAINKLLPLLQEIEALFPAQTRNTSTFTIAKLNAGEAINQLAARATASIDIRFASIEDAVNIEHNVRKICKKHHAVISNEIYSGPSVNDPNDPYLTSFAHSIEKIIGRPAGTVTSIAASDGRFFTEKNIPCAIFYPTGGGHHGAKEWIAKEAYTQLQQVFLDYLHKEAYTDSRSANSAIDELELAFRTD